MDFETYYPLLLLGVGMVVIIVLILYLRINAFLALICAALCVGLLSPRVFKQTPEQDALETFATNLTKKTRVRNILETTKEYDKQQKQVTQLREEIKEDSQKNAPRLSFINVPKLIAQEFGRMMTAIGLSIAFATIIGLALMESGAADRIVRSITGVLGEKAGALAMLISGYILAIPVFFDTVFLLLVPLAKALRLRTGKNYLLYLTAIGAGGAITHSLVPPTPGPLTMAAELGVNLGVSIGVGFLFGIPLAIVGLAYASLANRIWPVPLRQVGNVTLEELEREALKPAHELPSLFWSLFPIVLPVLLITVETVYSTMVRQNPDYSVSTEVAGITLPLSSILAFFGNKNIALLLAAFSAMFLVASKKGWTRQQLGTFTARALDDAGMILLITCAGGAFGGMLNAVGVGDSLKVLSDEFTISPLVLAWVVAALIKIAQGSGTVSMITTVIIINGIVNPSELPYHPVYLLLAIGCGSKVASWMNDSGFWVVCKMGGLTEVETLRSWTITLIVMGVTGLPLLLLLTRILPLK